jgi:hypothetical protein
VCIGGSPKIKTPPPPPPPPTSASAPQEAKYVPGINAEEALKRKRRRSLLASAYDQYGKGQTLLGGSDTLLGM